MIDRRLFIKATAGTAVGSMLHLGCSDSAPITADEPAGASADATDQGRSLDKIGVQLYTVRDLMETDFVGTLDAVAKAGYDEVEFHDYFGNEPQKVKEILQSLGLEAPASHVSLDALRRDLAGTIATARIVGHSYLICPWLAPEERTSLDNYRQLAAFFNEVGTACRDAEMQFGWHNHEFEFEPIDGTLPFDVLLDETDPELVEFELDLYWILVGGADPFDYFDRYPGRFSLCHVKDRTAAGKMVDVGAGEIDFRPIFARSAQAGLQHYFVEHDGPADPIASITASHDFLAALTF